MSEQTAKMGLSMEAYRAELRRLPYGSTEESVHEAFFSRNLIVLLQSQGSRISPERVTSDGR